VLTAIETVFAQIKIGDNPKVLNPDAILEIESTNKGVLLPRLSLRSTTSSFPLKKFTAGMMVYNTSSINDLTPGIYYSDGIKWTRGTSNTVSVQQYNEQIVSNDKSAFKTPAIITDASKIFLYRNGVMISFSVKDNNTIISELPCQQGDHIRIVQLL
jgi:hypothetical protein